MASRGRHRQSLRAARALTVQRYGFRVAITKRDLWKWEGNHCGICGEEIASIDDASIDHITPLVEGGSESFANVRLTHIACNVRRGSDWSSQSTGDVPRASVRKRGLWRAHEQNPCGVCGEPITSKAEAWITYIVPLEDGGADHRDNTHLVHQECVRMDEEGATP